MKYSLLYPLLVLLYIMAAANHVDSFTSTWQAGEQCSSSSHYHRHGDVHSSSKTHDTCTEYLEEGSELSRCFKSVNPEPYLNLCLHQHPDSEHSKDERACNTIAAYVEMCQHHYIDVKLPEHCAVCHDNQGHLVPRHTTTIEGGQVPLSADVLFIIEQKYCNRKIIIDSLDDIARDLDREFGAVGLTGNRYGVVSYGREGSNRDPHSHTAHGKLFTDARNVVLTVKNMVFSGNDPSDALAAIKHASKYPFRRGATKIFILVNCNRCTAASETTDLADVFHILLRSNIVVHLLSEEDFKIRGREELNKQVIGVDGRTAYKLKDVGQSVLTGEPELLPHVIVPNDLCFYIAQRMNGSIFKSDMLLEPSGNTGKTLRDILTRRVAMSAQPPACQHCSCKMDQHGFSYHDCQPCQIPSPNHIKLEDRTSDEDYLQDGHIKTA